MGSFDLNSSGSQDALNSSILRDPRNLDAPSLPLLDESSFANVIYPTPPNNTPTNTSLGSLNNTGFMDRIAPNLPGVGVSTAELFPYTGPPPYNIHEYYHGGHSFFGGRPKRVCVNDIRGHF